MVHFYRNVFSHVPATKVREVSHMLKAIHAQESRDAADRKARAIVDDLRAAKMNTAADLVERSVSETLTYYAFPDIHWQKIRTNNPLERIMKEIRRRTRVVGAFPDGQSCLNLAAARLRYIAGTAWSTKCYMNMRPLYQWGLSMALHEGSEFENGLPKDTNLNTYTPLRMGDVPKDTCHINRSDFEMIAGG